MFEKKILPTENVLDFLKEYCADGWTFSNLLQNLPFESGTVWTYLPPRLSSERVYQFQWGGLFHFVRANFPDKNKTDYESPKELTFAYIKQYLDETKHSFGVFEEFMSSPSDRYMEKRSHEPYLFFEKEVYSFITGPATSAEVEHALGLAIDFRCVGILGKFPAAATVANFFQRQQYVTLEQLKSLVENTEVLIALVYDMEGYLIWRRS